MKLRRLGVNAMGPPVYLFPTILTAKCETCLDLARPESL
jgi:hypothetical protein